MITIILQTNLNGGMHMKQLLVLITACALCTTGVFADTLLNIDFENPPYTLGELDGQQMWSTYPGTAPESAVVNASPTPSQGSQCALVVSTNNAFCADMYDARTTINDSTFNTNTHYLRVAMDILPKSNYDACDLRISVSNLTRLVLFGIWTDANSNAVANLNGTDLNIPVTWGEWHELSVLMDCKNQKVIEFTVDGSATTITNRPFWAQAAYPQMLRISTSNALDFWAAFDAIWVTTEPIPEPGMIGAVVLGLLFLIRRK